MLEERLCKLCGVAFVPKARHQVYCTPAHGQEASNARRSGGKSYERACLVCGAVFRTHRPDQKYCPSPDCRQAAEARRRRQAILVPPFWPNALRNLVLKSVADGERAIYLSDIQIPFQDKGCLAAVESFMEDWKPQRVFYVGDILDLYAWTPFGDRPPMEQDITDELSLARSVFARHREIVGPQAEMYLTLGNHEERGARITLAHPEFRRFVSSHLTRDMGLEEHRITYLDWGGCIDYRGFLVTHGTWHSNALYAAGKGAQRAITTLGGSGCMGHTHRRAAVAYSSLQASHTFYELGCLCRLDQPWVKGHPDWQWGFGISTIWRGKVHFRQIPIFEDGFYAPETGRGYGR